MLERDVVDRAEDEEHGDDLHEDVDADLKAFDPKNFRLLVVILLSHVSAQSGFFFRPQIAQICADFF